MNVSSLKDIFTVEKKKKRNDSVASKWNRILGSRIILMIVIITSWCWSKDMIVIITSWCWSKDKMNCLKGEEGPYPKFVTKSSWMRGLLLYKELMAEPRSFREFGIPDDIGDYHIQNNRLMLGCRGLKCKKMARVYFLSYQWAPFLFLRFSFFLQIPYLIFKQGIMENS